jgi:hypothetical protein
MIIHPNTLAVSSFRPRVIAAASSYRVMADPYPTGGAAKGDNPACFDQIIEASGFNQSVTVIEKNNLNFQGIFSRHDMRRRFHCWYDSQHVTFRQFPESLSLTLGEVKKMGRRGIAPSRMRRNWHKISLACAWQTAPFKHAVTD